MPDLAGKPNFPASRVDFGALIPWKLALLQKAFARFDSARDDLQKEFNFFCADNAAWLDDFALFMSLKEANGGGAWSNWAKAIRQREQAALDRLARR